MRFALILVVACSAPVARKTETPAEDPGVTIATPQLVEAIHARWLGDPARAAKLLANAGDVDGLAELGRAELALGHVKAADAAFERAVTRAEHGTRGTWEWPAHVASRVAHLAFTPNGRWILVANTEGHVDIHDAGSLRVARSFDLSEGYPRVFEISPNGRWLATGVQTTQVWDLETLAMVGDYPYNNRVAFTQANHLLSTLNEGGFVEIDVATKQIVGTIHGPKYGDIAAAGDRIYAVDNVRVVTFDTKYEQSIKSYPRAITNLRATDDGYVVSTEDALVIGDTEIRGRFYALAVSGSLVAATTNKGIQIFDGGKLVQRLVDLNLDTLAFHPRGELLVTAGWESSSLWKASTGEHLAYVRRPAAAAASLAFDARGDNLAVGGGSGHATIWSLASGTAKTITVKPSTYVDMIALGPDGELAAAAADILTPGRTQSVLAVFAANGTRRWTRELDRIYYLGYRPRTNQLTTVSMITKEDESTTNAALLWRGDGTIATTLELIASRGFHWNGDGSAFAGTTNQELVSTALDGTITRIDLPHYSSALDPSGKRFAASLDDGKVSIWDLATKRPTRVLFDSSGTMSALAWTPDGKTLVTAAADTLALWDPDTGVRLAAFSGPSNILSLAIRPDGRVIAAGHIDGRVTLWSIASGKQIATLHSPGELTAFVTTPDGAVDGAVFDGQLAWHAGKHTLPGRGAFARQHVPKLLATRLAQLPATTAPVRANPISPPPPPACYTDGEHNSRTVNTTSLDGNTLRMCLEYSYFVKPRVSLRPPMMCFDVDLVRGTYTPHAPAPLEALGIADVPKITSETDGKLAHVCVGETCRAVDIRDTNDPDSVTVYTDDDAKHLAVVYRIPVVARAAVLVYDVASGKRISQFIAQGEGTSFQFLGPSLLVTTTPCAGPCSTSTLFDIKKGREIAGVAVNTSALSAANLGNNVWAFNDWDSTLVVLQNVRTGRVVKSLKLPKKACTNEPDNEYVSCDGITMLAAGSKLVILPSVRPGDVMVVDLDGKLLADHHLPICQ